MELLIGGLAALAALGYGVYQVTRLATESRFGAHPAYRPEMEEQARQRLQAESVRRRWQIETARHQRERARRLNLLARNLQLALFHLDTAADFRRAASWAAKAREVPLVFRQRQFRRFRQRLMQHFATRLRAGTDAGLLTESLTELLRSLGVSAFEADYIRSEAERHLTTNTTPPETYSSALLHLQREHEQRLVALERLPGLDTDTREQLVEAENTRFREALEHVGRQEPPPPVSPTDGG